MEISSITRQRIIFIWLIVIALLLAMLRHWIRYVLIIPIGSIALFVLGTLVFPLYTQWPNVTLFYKQQPSTLFFATTGQSLGKIQIQNTLWMRVLDGKGSTQRTLPNNLQTIISFVSSSQTVDENCFLLLPEGTSIMIRPQSQVTFLSQYPKIWIDVQKWDVAELPSDNYSPRQFFLTGVGQLDGFKNSYQLSFEEAKLKAIGTQGQGIFMQNPYLKAINKWILQTLVRLWPAKYSANIKNFQEFETYIPSETIRQTDTTVDSSIQTEMWTQAKKWWEETQIYQRWHRLFK